MLTRTLRQAKRTVIALIGMTVVLLGLVMLVTPGPGWLFVFLGLSLLAAEFVWAQRLLKRLGDAGSLAGETLLGRRRTRPDQIKP
jgi:tellurite resistance protein TerC/cation:H+ antiporter